MPAQALSPQDGVCDRTAAIRDAIVSAVTGTTDCAEITETQLGQITTLFLLAISIPALAADDLVGLSGLVTLNLAYTGLTRLPPTVFDDLTSLDSLSLNNNQLQTLPAGIFAGLTGLDELSLASNPGFPFGPVAEAGPTFFVSTDREITLRGSGGSDPWGRSVTYAWTQSDSSGVVVPLDGDTTATPSLTAPAVEQETLFRFELTVTAVNPGGVAPPGTTTAGDSATDSAPVRVQAAVPVSVHFHQAPYAATEGGRAARVAIRLDKIPRRSVSIPLKAVPAAGADATDYSIPASVTFGFVDRVKYVTVTATDDSVDDDGESLTLSFGDSLPVAVARGSPSSVTVELADNDAPVGVRISGLSVTSDPGTDSVYVSGDTLEVTATFGDTVTVSGRPQLALSVGTSITELLGRAERNAGYVRGSGTTKLVFAYGVVEGDDDPDGVSVASGSLDLNGGSVQDGDGMDAVLAHGGLALQPGHRVDALAPTLGEAFVDGSGLTLRYSEPLDEISVPPPTAFSVSVGGASRTVSAVGVSGKLVNVTLATAVQPGEEASVGYTLPATGRIRDEVGLAATAFSNQSTTNYTLPTVSIAAVDPNVYEGTDVDFTLTRNGPTIRSLQATVRVRDSGDVLLGTSGDENVTFAADDSTAWLTLKTHDNHEYEAHATISATVIGGAYHVSETAGTASVTVSDNDLPETDVTLSAPDSVAEEVDTFVVQVSARTISDEEPHGSLSVRLRSSDSTAQAGSDYSSVSEIVRFLPADFTRIEEGGDGRYVATASRAVTIFDDSLREGDETFALELTRPGVIADDVNLPSEPLVVTIVDNEERPPLSVANAEAAEGSPVTFTVTLAVTSTRAVTATWTASIEGGDTAQAKDLESTTGTVTVTAGQTTAMITVPTADDPTDEDNETFTLTLSSPSSNATLATDAAATGTITDNDAAPTISVEDQTVNEGEQDPDDLTEDLGFPLRVTLSAASERRVTYKIRRVELASDTATAEDLFTSPDALHGTEVISLGDTVEIRPTKVIRNDDLDESDETFTLEIHDFENATAGARTRTTITIEDDDDPPTVSVGDATADEGDPVEFAVTLSPASGWEVTVDWATSGETGDTATAGTDFTAASGTLTFMPGETEQAVTVETTEDSTSEDNETFTLTLSKPSNATLAADPTATGTIGDDDALAQPQTSCAPNPDDIWCGLVTVMEYSIVGESYDGFLESEAGDLSEKNFTYGVNRYTIDAILVGKPTGAGEGRLLLSLTSELTQSDKAALVLYVGGTAIPFAVSHYFSGGGGHWYFWEGDAAQEGSLLTPGPGLDWTSETTVTVRLREASATCTPQGAIWCGVVTPGDLAGEYGFLNHIGLLSDTDFEHDRTPYTIDEVSVSDSGQLRFSLTADLTGAHRAALALHVDGSSGSFAFSDATDPAGSHTYQWLDTGLDWSSVPPVTLRLRHTAPTFPGKPTNLTATGNGSTQIDLGWDAPDPGTAAITGYRIEVWADAVTGWTDLVANTGNADTTYAHTGLSAGDTRHYRVSAINTNGTSVASDERSATTLTNVPVFTDATATRMVAENSAADTDVGDAFREATDADGDPLTYSMEGTDTASFTFDASTRQIKTKTGVTYDFEAKNTYSVTVKADDGTGGTDTIAVTITLTNVDEGRSGTVSIDDTAPMVGDELTASTADVDDPDGLPDPFAPTWQWYRTPAGGAEAEISGATSATYTVVEADLDAALAAKASWTDLGGFANTLASAPTSAVTAEDSGTLPELSVADAEATEGDDVTFTLTLSPVSGREVTVHWATSVETGDTATSGTDFTAVPATKLTFMPGDTTQTVTVQTTADRTSEDNETFTVTLSRPSNATLAADPTATGTIGDDDALAQPQTSCAPNPGDIWCGVVTVMEYSIVGESYDGFLESEAGDLSEKNFTYGVNRYTIDAILVGKPTGAGEGRLLLSLTSELTQSDKAALVLYVGGTAIPFAVSHYFSGGGGHWYFWEGDAAQEGSLLTPGPGLDWTSETTVTVRLREASATCTPQGAIWCGVVTPGDLAGEYGFLNHIGLLSDTDFEHDRTPYTIDEVSVSDSGQLRFSLTADLTGAHRAALALHVDGSSGSFAFSDATDPAGSHTYQWLDTGLDWSSVPPVTLRLRHTAPTFPGKPTNLTATGNGSTQIDLGWDAPDPGTAAITGYRIEVWADAVTGWTDLVANTGNADTTYAHTGLSAGDTRHYRVSAININGTSVASDERSATTLTNVPVFTDATATRMVAENSAADTDVGDAFREATDADGDPLTYSMEGTDTASFTFDASTRQIKTKTGVTYDFEAKNTYSVTVKADDGTGGTDTIAVTITLTNVDEGQSGTVSIDDTAPMVGDELTASTADVADPDGLPDPFEPTWKWYRTPAGGAEAEISGATSATYTVVEADLGAALAAKASWTDAGGFANTLASAPTSTVTAEDSGTLPELSVADAEADEGADVTFTVTLSAASTQTVTVDWATSVETGDTATSGTDFTAVPATTLTVMPGDTTATFTVSTVDDTTDEANETFTVTLSSPSNATLAVDPTATGTIGDDGTANAAPSFTSSTTFGVDENGTTVGTVAASDRDTGDDITGYALSGGADQALFAIDKMSGALTFQAPPNYEDPQDADTDNAYVVEVQATGGTGDRELTAPQTITVTVTNADEGQSGTVSIDDTAPMVGDELTASTADVADPDGLPDPFEPTWQWYRTPSGGAEAEISGAASATYTVVEADLGAALAAKASWTDAGGFANTLASAPTSAVTAEDSGTLPELSVADAEADEGEDVTFTVTLSAASTQTVTVDWATSVETGDTAASGTDFTAATNTLTFMPGDTMATFTVSTVDDTTDEANETFTVTLSNPSNATLAVDPTATGTIGDDGTANVAPSFTSSTTFGVDENGTTVGTVAASDSDTGDDITGYALSGGADQALFAIDGTSGALTFLTAPDYEAPQDADTDNAYVVEVQATSGTGDRVQMAPQTITVTVTNADEGQSGMVSIDDTAPMVGDELTASTADVADPDGLPDPFEPTWKWHRTPAGGSETEIAGESSATYTVVEADLGAALTAKASWTDAGGFANTLASAPTSAVTAALPKLSVADAEATEGEDVAFTVTLSAAAAENVTVNWATSVETGDTAISGTDFTAASSTLTFMPGDTEKTVTVQTTEDTTDEDKETFTLTLSSPSSNATLAADPTATGTIIDGDAPNAAPTAADGMVTTDEDTAYAFDASDFGFSDTDAADELASVRVVTLPGSGTLAVSDSAVSADQEVAASDLGGNLTYTPAADEHGSGYASFTFRVSDGTDESAADYTMTIDVTSVNDAPSTGTVSIDDTAPMVGDELTASTAEVDDPDGLPDPFAPTWKWYRTPADGAEAEISGATSATYTVVEADLGAALTAKASWTDAGGFANTLASAPTSAVTAEDSGTLPELSVADAEADEGEDVTFTVTLSVASTQTVTVDWATSVETGDTATAGTDFTAVPATTLTVMPGDTTATFTVSTVDDTTDEANETFTVTLSNPSNATLAADPTATGTIGDDDAPNAAPSFTSSTTFGVDENGTTVGTVAASDSDTGDDITGYALSGGADQALFAIDGTNGALTFLTAPDYEAPQDADTDNAYVVEVQATGGTGDRELTAPQTITVTVTNVDEGQSGTVSIDDTAPMVGDELTASTADVADPDGLPDPFEPTWQWYRTPSGGAEAEISGAASATYTVVEADLGAALAAKASWTDLGGFANTLASAPTSAVTAEDSGTLPELSVADAEADEGEDVTFTVTLSAASTQTVTVDWATSVETGDTATAGTDFTAVPARTLTFMPGETTATFTVSTVDDTTDEANETFTVTLSNPTNATLATDPTATGTIDDDDGPNAAPTAVDGTVTTAEDTAYAFGASDFGFTDTDTDDELASVRVVTLPGSGTLAVSGAAVSADREVAASDLGGNLKFTPAADEHGSSYASEW